MADLVLVDVVLTALGLATLRAAVPGHNPGFGSLADAALKSRNMIVLADWFARKNSRQHSGIYSVYYY